VLLLRVEVGGHPFRAMEEGCRALRQAQVGHVRVFTSILSHAPVLLKVARGTFLDRTYGSRLGRRGVPCVLRNFAAWADGITTLIRLALFFEAPEAFPNSQAVAPASEPGSAALHSLGRAPWPIEATARPSVPLCCIQS
jgi:hypothetical protein